MLDRPKIESWPETSLRGSKRTNLVEVMPDWFEGQGKSEHCRLEGSWYDLICLARNILASENTRLAMPEFHRPEWRIDNYTGPAPYDFGQK